MKKNITLKSISSISGLIKLPGSKSISNRVLLLSALSNGITTIKNLLQADDVSCMLNALKILGIKTVVSNNGSECKVFGIGKIPKVLEFSNFFLGNAGTVIRPLLAVLSIPKHQLVLTGNSRMQERPIGHLVDALRQGGAVINYVNNSNYPPILINGGFEGGEIFLNGNISSQFLSALLIAAPMAKKNTKITIIGNLVSKPYVDMTLMLIKKFGVCIKNKDYKIFEISGKQNYSTIGKYYVEGDASAASYFLAAAAIKGGKVVVKGIDLKSIQGDIYFAHILRKMGAIIKWKKNHIICIRKNLYGVDLDMNHIPDAAMTIAIVALFAQGVTTIRNIYNWRVKETDRLKAMSIELKKIGALIIEGKDFISIIPPKNFLFSSIETYEDHRMAMCFSLISLSNQSVKIIDPLCTSKTFPQYFELFNNISKKK
ncbi:3-phosphoshikimate 1-carboxyvinyltransferase [Buchnera aphidicola (Mollitrichosiphum nigrofasciatum)]|uniref:3-phosphoshikimate 1-carboxyvinyltransferase n=1 Tax=Buchnera aphidicola TaxID=9 RepID=UPI0031B7FB71